MPNYKPIDDHWQSRLAAIEGRPDSEPEEPYCEYCQAESEPGWIETDNNGPIVPCPICNDDGSKPRAE